MEFFYSFTQTIFHSLWQGLVIALFYNFSNFIFKRNHPLQKRNFLYLLLISQLSISIFTFLIYFNGYSLATALTFVYALKPKDFSYLYQYNIYVFSVYITVVFIKLAFRLFQWVYFKKRFKKGLVRPAATLKVFTQMKACQLGIKRKVEVWYSQNIQTPITFGFLKPIILLPLALVNKISIEQTETIILHELVHIKSKDYLFNWLLLGTEIIYFFNPFTKFIIRQLKQEREKNCDTQIINFEYDALQYAQTLLGIAKTNVQVKKFQIGFITKGSDLLNRIRFFSNEKNLAFTNKNTFSYLLLLLPLVCIICFSLIGKRIERSNPIAVVAPMHGNDFSNNNLILPEGIKAKTLVSKNLKSVYKTGLYKERIKNILGKIKPTDKNVPTAANDLYMPVSLIETADSTKEIVYKLETQNGKITQSYKLVQRKGRWIFEPQWMIVETRPTVKPVFDSIKVFNLPDSIQ